MFDNILLAVDGSEHGLHAAKVAGDLARATKAQTLRMIVVYDPLPSNLGEPNLSQAIASRQQEAQDIVDQTTKEVGKFPEKFTPRSSKDKSQIRSWTWQPYATAT